MTKNSSPVKLIWATPNGDNLIGYLARVSNASAKLEDPTNRLIKYLIDHKHWSPFEMVNACVDITTTREVSRQILRHRSFSFQEFSGRYAEYTDTPHFSEARLQDADNRQNSIEVDNLELHQQWERSQALVWNTAFEAYQVALKAGIAKELARKILPEGLVPTKLYVQGSMRSWIHYWAVRCTPETQKEHRLVAEATRAVVLKEFPQISTAIGYNLEGDHG